MEAPLLIGDQVEVFRSSDPGQVRESELVLRARAIPFSKHQVAGTQVLLVDLAWVERARAELASYDEENKNWPPAETLPPRAPGAMPGTVTALLLLVGAFAWQVNAVFGVEWKRLGAAHASSLLGGEPWRAVTALTLHTDVVHLGNNLLFGGLFGFLVAYTFGGGLGWLAILASGILGNLLNAWIQAPEHVSVGFSTAVFGAVGILGGSEWRRRRLLSQARLRRAGPVLMALTILGYYGISEEPRIDVMAHVTGLLAGLPIGALLPSFMARGGMRPGFQLGAGALGVALVLAAWLWGWFSLG